MEKEDLIKKLLIIKDDIYKRKMMDGIRTLNLIIADLTSEEKEHENISTT